MSHLTAFLLEEPWGEGHLHTRCPGQKAIYTVGLFWDDESELQRSPGVIAPHHQPGIPSRLTHSPCSTCLSLSFRVSKGKCDLPHLYMQVNESGTRHAAY